MLGKFFRQYLAFSTSERNGILVLISILVILIFTPSIIDIFYKDEITDFSEIEKKIEGFNLQKIKPSNNEELNEKIKNAKLLSFNPNTVTKKELEDLGISKRIAKNVINYRKKGGVFKSKEDFKKIYGVSEQLYNKLEAYIIINDKTLIQEEYRLQNFDPNQLTETGWKEIGINEKIINTIQNYKNKGGVFYNKADLKKIYGLSEQLYLKLEPYIKIDSTLLVSSIKELADSAIDKKNIIIELNNADSAELSLIIKNRYLISRIIKYRKALGGFYNTNQLLEVYSFTDTNLLDNFIVDSSMIIKININSITFKQLNSHPYIEYDETKAIFMFKKLMDEFKNIDEIVKNNLLSKDKFTKIKPYLTCK